MEVPKDVATMHLTLLNSASSLLSDLESFRVILTDPIKGLTTMQQLTLHMVDFQTNIDNIKAYFKYKKI